QQKSLITLFSHQLALEIRLKQGGGKILNRRGSYRLGTQDDGKDENNSWNGNSFFFFKDFIAGVTKQLTMNAFPEAQAFTTQVP
uniref:Uncharacterized protein n=1 Tax=Ursus americanus TaxID=9643 RepID=A0A452SKZ9_URSAM